MILREDGDDLIGAYSGSLIGYSFKKPSYHNLKKDGADISLHLDKYEKIDRIQDKNVDRPGCIISDFYQTNRMNNYFDKLYRKLEHSLSSKK